MVRPKIDVNLGVPYRRDDEHAESRETGTHLRASDKPSANFSPIRVRIGTERKLGDKMSVEPGTVEEVDAWGTPCATDLDLYLHPLLEEPPSRSTSSKELWSEYEQLVFRARESCSACPLLADCLYKAIVQTEVAGYVGCTTPRERLNMRRHIGIKVSSEDFDAYAGARGSRQPINHDDVLRMRSAHPDDSLEQIAARLECSLSTVKRHLRRARQEEAAGPRPERKLPSMEDVFDAFEKVVESNRARRRAC